MVKPRTFNQFIRDESAVGTVMALFWFIVCAGIVGLSVDAANAWRQKERLQLTADVASHAGILEVLAGASDADIRLAAHNSVISNMPNAGFGRVIDTDINDIILSDYSDDSNSLAAPGTIDAVTVQLHRNNTVDNPVGTYLLQFVGFPGWEVTRYGTTVLTDYGDCPLYEGIWAHGQITLSSGNTIGPDYCVHSQDFVWLPQQNTFLPDSHLSMPSLLDCKDKCIDSANYGSYDARNELNLIMPTFDDIILQAYDNMIDPGTNAAKTSFWDGKSIDQSQLIPEWDNLFGTAEPGPGETGYAAPAVGTVVNLTVAEFEAMDLPPAGLTYNVRCNPNGNGINTHLNMWPSSSGDPVRDIVVLTNCSIDFEANSDWRGSMVVSTRERANATLTASSSARAGDPTQSCYQPDQTFIYARSDMQVAAEFASSNTVFMSGGNVQIASGTSGTVTHNGMTLYADGNVNLTTQHNYNSCGYRPDEDILGIPGFKYIKQVMPTNEVARIAAANP